MNWDKNNHIEKVMPAANKLISHFEKKNVKFTIDDGKNNVVFSVGEKSIKISHHSFFRFSGIACVYKVKEMQDGQKKLQAIIDVTDDMYMENYMKPVIEILFKEYGITYKA